MISQNLGLYLSLLFELVFEMRFDCAQRDNRLEFGLRAKFTVEI